ncbi:MAG: hypothetical protein ABI856_11880 [Nitrospira sp.]
MLLLAVWIGLTLLLASALQAQVIHPDQMIGSPAPQKEAIPEGGVMSNEPTAGDLEKGFDRQMVMPEFGASGGMDTNLLKTPDATDAENARESDSQSAVSF